MILVRTLRSLLFAGLVLQGFPALPAGAAETPVVKIQNFAFVPPVLTVKVGTAVLFQNDDDIPHLVAATDGSFRSKALDTGDQYSVTFGKAGSVPYFCALHPHMQATITVVP